MKPKYAKPPIKTQNKTKAKSNRINEITRHFKCSSKYMAIPPNQTPKIIGSGAFGAVFEIQDASGNFVAIKKVIQDPKYKNREKDILLQINHPNCIHVIETYSTKEGDPPSTFLHIVTELFPTDLSSYSRKYCPICIPLVKAFSYQILSALSYLHQNGICHRDIKPSNVLINPTTGILKICDFGSAKHLLSGEISVSYIATRSYRAPELLYDNRSYSFAVDIWAAGCVIVEMFLGGKVFFSASSQDEMPYKIASVIGSPTPEEVVSLHGNKTYNLPKKKKGMLPSILGSYGIPNDLIAILEMIFVYDPVQRATANQCLNSPFFDEIRNGTLVLPNDMLFQLPK